MKFKTYNLDCRDVMDMFLPDNSVDSIVTDPPYGLSFMGKGWDHGVPSVEFWERAFRVLKPGGHLLAFGGPRTYHRLACAIEDAGFEIRDSVMWMFGSGFPKSLDVSKAIDKAAGAEREVIRTEQNYGVTTAKDGKQAYGDYAGEWDVTAPATEAAQQWDGWGTALKPAYEPVVVARKPLIGTVVQNVLAHGVGGLNIDGCRVSTDDKLGGGHASGGQQMQGGWERPWMADPDAVAANAARSRASIAKSEDLGRWPANLIHDGSAEVVALFPDTGKSAGGGMKDLKAGSLFQGDTNPNSTSASGFGDSGSAARFFYVPKASKKDRNENCEGVITWENAGQQDQILSVLSQARGISEATTRHLADSEWNTMLFGSCSTAQYQSDLTFTIRTALKLITTLKTSNCCQNSTTNANILDAIRTIQAGGLNLVKSAECINLSLQSITCEKTVSALGAVLVLLKTLSEISEKGKTGNVHSTVKPTDLMAYLCRLVTPPGGTVLDPFMGSGSTGKAALREGFRFIGCELEAEYHAIADARLKAAV